MKVLPFVFAAVAHEPTRAAASLQAARWRQALEQAQWRQLGDRPLQDRAGGSAEAAQAPVSDVARVPARLASGGPDPSAPDTGAQPVVDGATGRGASPLPDESRVAVAAMGTGPGEAAAAAAGPVATTIPAATASTRLTPGVSEVALAEPALPSLWNAVAPAPWPPFNAQAHVDGRAVSAAVRDARLAAGDADELERRLAAQLAADGLELVELRVNGRIAGSPLRDSADPRTRRA